jgi:uncharacterized membrane protein YeaQ/YmgE (transglycosylase-associated protein family)
VGLVAVLLFLVLGGFILGALARLAVPGPDPMPFWLTVAIGVGGSIIGGLVMDELLFGRTGSLVLAYVAAVVLVILYRRVVQKRGITGPEARTRPTRGWGLRR